LAWFLTLAPFKNIPNQTSPGWHSLIPAPAPLTYYSARPVSCVSCIAFVVTISASVLLVLTGAKPLRVQIGI